MTAPAAHDPHRELMVSSAVDDLHRAFDALAPDATVQAHMYGIRKAMERDHLPPKNVALTIASAIVDGLRNGNWPRGDSR